MTRRRLRRSVPRRRRLRTARCAATTACCICELDLREAAVTTSSTTIADLAQRRRAAATRTGSQVGGQVRPAHIDMPPTNTEMKKETRNDLTSPTCRVPDACTRARPSSPSDVNGVPKMSVISPWTRYTNVAATKGRDQPDPVRRQPGYGRQPARQHRPVRRIARARREPDLRAGRPGRRRERRQRTDDRSAACRLHLHRRPPSRPAGWTFVNTVTSASRPVPLRHHGERRNRIRDDPVDRVEVASTYKHYDCRAR